MLHNIILYRPVPIPSLPLQDFPSLGLLETPQVSYLVIIPVHQHEHDKKRAGLPGQLVAGHMDQVKSQWAAGEVLLLSPSSRLSILSRDRTCPLSSSPASGVFSQNLCGITKDQDCQHQGSVFNVTLTAVTTVNITENRRERGGLLWDKSGGGD